MTMFMIDLGGDSHYSRLGVSPDASAEEIRQARDRLIRELRERVRREPGRKDELTERQQQINGVADVLVRPAKRQQYDRGHEHLRFFTIRSAAAPVFTSQADRIDVLHRVISAHLRAAGVELRPLSDVDRSDFAADVTPNTLLDDLIGQC
ncbi:DnaJ domain-containing protein [Lentzea sp. NPDC042327]|uniref:J domain-containing protein n=1 Tax=Lentzea sp. NPDC042327 TaxID=3154801 RepID=UPI0033C91F7A